MLYPWWTLGKLVSDSGALDERELLAPIPRGRRPRGARRSRRAHAPARTPAGAPLRQPGRVARRPRAGRLARADQGDRPLRRLARAEALDLRRAHDPRRDQAPLPRPGVVAARPARPPGAQRPPVQGDRPARPTASAARRPSRSWPRPRTAPSSACSTRCRARRPSRPSRSTSRRATAARPRPTRLGAEDEEFAQAERRELLRLGLGALPEREREILHLRFFAGLTQREIADRVGISQMHVSQADPPIPGQPCATRSRGPSRLKVDGPHEGARRLGRSHASCR